MDRRRHTITALASLAALAGASLSGACAARAHHAAPAGVVRATVDTIATHLAELELRRLAVEGAGMVGTPERRELELRIAALREELRELPDAAPAARAVDRHVLDALDARQAGLAVRRRELLVRYTPEHPLVRQAEGEALAVERRRAEMRAALGDPDGGAAARR
jgi:hypothetical protein